MPTFEIETNLSVELTILCDELFTIDGINRGLAPYIKISAPKLWCSKLIREWPVGGGLFNSKVTLLGFIPIEYHCFRFTEVSKLGFIESSRTSINKEWNHHRTIAETTSGSTVKDIIEYKSKFPFLGYILIPLYKGIFIHRHNKLKAKYNKNITC